jgi:hypothetical protein
MKTILVILALSLPAAALAGDYRDNHTQFTLPKLHQEGQITITGPGNQFAIGTYDKRTGDTYIQDMTTPRSNRTITGNTNSWGDIDINDSGNSGED